LNDDSDSNLFGSISLLFGSYFGIWQLEFDFYKVILGNE